MAVNDVYRLSVDYTLASQVTSPVSGKTAFIPQFTAVSSSGTEAAVGTNAADAVASSTNGTTTRSFNYAYNGASWDRQRGDTNGIVVQSALSSTFWSYAAAAGGIVSSTADVVLKAASGAGVRNFLKTLNISHDVLVSATEIVVKDGSTVIWRGKLQTTANEGLSEINFDPPLKGTANTALNVALLTSTTGGVFVNATGFTGS